MQGQKDYSRQGLRGHQLTLGKLRIKAKGSWVQTEDEKGLLCTEQRRKERRGIKQPPYLH